MSTATLQPCGCCKTTQIDTHVAAFDHHLDTYVCPDCRTKLVSATAWLKHAGMPHCSKVAKG